MTAIAQSQDEAQIRELLAGQERAMRARDADWLVARFTPDAVDFSLAPPLRHSGPELLDPSGLQSWFAGFDGPIEYEIGEVEVTCGADVAFCLSLNRLSATPLGSTEPFDLWYRATVGLRKLDGAWRVAHEHTSVPFYMDGTFGAALDLKP